MDYTARSEEPITLVMSETPVIIRQLHWPGFRRLDLRIRTGKTAAELLGLVGDVAPDAMVLQARLPDQDAFVVLDRIRESLPRLPVVIISAQGVFDDLVDEDESRCEILGCPLSRGQLYEVLTPHLDLPGRGKQPVTVTVSDADGQREIRGVVSNLAVSGARLILPEPVEERMVVSIAIECNAGRAELPGRVIWCRSRALRSEELRIRRPSRRTPQVESEVSVQFIDADETTRDFLRKITCWELTVDDAGMQQVQLLRGLTEMSDLGGLSSRLRGTVQIDLSQVNVVYSVGITRWVKFLRQIPDDVQYQFKNCSTAFCLQGSTFEDLFGRGQVLTVFAPYCCTSCAYEGERLIRINQLDLAQFPPPLPPFICPWCSGPMHFDDLPERYFGFLRQQPG